MIRRCNICGREISDNDAFCPYCGQRFADGEGWATALGVLTILLAFACSCASVLCAFLPIVTLILLPIEGGLIALGCFARGRASHRWVCTLGIIVASESALFTLALFFIGLSR